MIGIGGGYSAASGIGCISYAPVNLNRLDLGQLEFPNASNSLCGLLVLVLPLPIARRAIYMELSRSTKPLFLRLLAGA
jgi:hypothetical protein